MNNIQPPVQQSCTCKEALQHGGACYQQHSDGVHVLIIPMPTDNTPEQATKNVMYLDGISDEIQQHILDLLHIPHTGWAPLQNITDVEAFIRHQPGTKTDRQQPNRKQR